MPLLQRGDRRIHYVQEGSGVLKVDTDHANQAADLLHVADTRLYNAKRAGRNRVAPSARIGHPTARPAATPPPTTFLPPR